MSWVRFDDTVAFNRKVVSAGNEAAGAWMRMTCWSASQLTDGAIPRDIALLIVGISRAEVLTRLVDVGLLDRDGDDYRIHDYHDHNPSAEEVLERRARTSEVRREAGKRGAAARWDSKRDGKAIANQNGNGQQALKQIDGPVPSRPVPDKKENEQRAGARVGELKREMTIRWGPIANVLMPDALSVEACARLLAAWAEAKGETDLPALAERALRAFVKLLASWSFTGAATPALFVKKWDDVQAVLGGVDVGKKREHPTNGVRKHAEGIGAQPVTKDEEY